MFADREYDTAFTPVVDVTFSQLLTFVKVLLLLLTMPTEAVTEQLSTVFPVNAAKVELRTNALVDDDVVNVELVIIVDE